MRTLVGIPLAGSLFRALAGKFKATLLDLTLTGVENEEQYQNGLNLRTETLEKLSCLRVPGVDDWRPEGFQGCWDTGV